MIETTAKVEVNRELAPGYRLMNLTFDSEIQTGPGQFAMLKSRGAFEPILRRALAVYRQTSSNELSFLYQVLGRGTQSLSTLQIGGRVEVLAPLGNCWILPSPSEQAIVVAGGIGSASVLMLCEELVRSHVE